MENRGLLFIPDISGFTKFVTETEIGHSRLIIEELLEIIVSSNELGLEISEIEGDAILFYKFGDSPQLQKLYTQVSKMFCDFHRHLMAYDTLRYCQCKACKSAIDLSLKVVSHYGEFTGYNVRNFSKLIGKDVIVAHQLLKNDISQHEYWLVTNSLWTGNAIIEPEKNMHWQSGSKKTESGEIEFHYTQLDVLKKELSPPPYPQLELDGKEMILSISKEYDTDLITLFHATGDFNYRSGWMEGVESVEELDHYLPRVGMRCKCITNTGENIIYATSYYYQRNRVEFSETDEDKNVTYFTLEKLGEDKTKLTLDYYSDSHSVYHSQHKHKLEMKFSRSLLILQEVLTGLDFKIPEEEE